MTNKLIKKNLFFLFIIFCLFFINRSSFAEIIKLDCSLKFDDGEIINNKFVINSKTDTYYNKFMDNQIFWTTVTKKDDDKWLPIYHHLDRATGIYTAGFGVITDRYPKKKDPISKIVVEKKGLCVAYSQI